MRLARNGGSCSRYYPVKGQNDIVVDPYVVSPDEFEGYVALSQRVETYEIKVVPESNDLMTGSYVMVDPAGRFFDNTSGAPHLQSVDYRGGCRGGVSGSFGRLSKYSSPGMACMIGRMNQSSKRA